MTIYLSLKDNLAAVLLLSYGVFFLHLLTPSLKEGNGGRTSMNRPVALPHSQLVAHLSSRYLLFGLLLPKSSSYFPFLTSPLLSVDDLESCVLLLVIFILISRPLMCCISRVFRFPYVCEMSSY